VVIVCFVPFTVRVNWSGIAPPSTLRFRLVEHGLPGGHPQLFEVQIFGSRVANSR
jgi:hypothetical protein